MTPQDAILASEQTSKMTGVRRLASCLAPLRFGYGQIYFSQSWATAALFAAATFVIPWQGLSGLMGLVLSTLFAWAIGMPKAWVKKGYFAYNGLLQGLALGLTYEINGAFFVLLLITSFIGVGVSAGIRILFERYINIPILSLPFVITTWIMVAAAGRFDELVYTLEPFEMAATTGGLPFVVVFFAKSLGAAFFQLSIGSGLLVALGILIYSRHAFALAIVGLASGSGVHLLLGGSFTDLNNMWIGFNFALTAIAVGGVWVVPALDSLLLAAIGGATCSVLTAASYQFLAPLGLPVLAIPFVATTSIILFALRSRIQAKPFESVLIPKATPEANLKMAKNVSARFVGRQTPAFALPLSGKWTVTQGVNGAQTHRSHWAHALDFEIINDDGNAYTGSGHSLSDFTGFQKPVFAPADGKVVKIVNHVDDNPIGQVNQNENWGNLVIIWHYGSVYTSLCHLAKGSVCVEEGQTIYKGQRLGRVGNSGRSPVPHLHFQVQLSPEIGAPTTPCEILNYLTETPEGLRYHLHSMPNEGDVIRPLVNDNARFAAVGFPLGNKYHYRTQTKRTLRKEVWQTDIDFEGNRYLKDENSGAVARIYVDKNVFLVLDYKGPRDCGLAWLFLACPRIPITSQEVFWEDELPGEHLLPFLRRQVFDLVEPIGSLARLKTRSRFLDHANGRFGVETRLSFKGLLADKNIDGVSTVVRFDRKFGLISLTAKKGEAVLFSVELEEGDEND